MNSIGVVGKGKTGQAIIEVLSEKEAPLVFSKSSPIRLEALKTSNLKALIVFIPADGLKEILPTLLETGLPVVCGTTGFSWPSDLHAELVKRKIAWITGSNFSPGMNFLFALAKLVQKNLSFLGNPNLKIHEIHHVHKKDSPSGTALKLNERLQGAALVTADRLGDHPGLHELTISSGLETLLFRHEAIDRKAFANGAVYAAQELLPALAPGLHSFESLMEQKVLETK